MTEVHSVCYFFKVLRTLVQHLEVEFSNELMSITALFIINHYSLGFKIYIISRLNSYNKNI